MKICTLKLGKSFYKNKLILVLWMMGIALLPVEALAQVNADPSGSFCLLIGIIQGKLGKALATLAVITLGIVAMFGSVRWTQAIMVATGVSVVFGAVGLITAMYGAPCG
jgi:type IV secretory pathway VirB2 component (pilin)